MKLQKLLLKKLDCAKENQMLLREEELEEMNAIQALIQKNEKIKN